MVTLLLACAGEPPVETPAAVADTGERLATEVVGDAPPITLDAPGLATIDCAAAIPVDGKTDCTMVLTWPDGDVEWSGPVGVGIHGRSSSGFPKAQYAIELDRDRALFGMEPADDDWLLNGMYIDRALFRNALAYDLFRALGGVAPQHRYVELTLNGDWVGAYSLVSRLDAARVGLGDDGEWLVKASEEGIPSILQYGTWEVLHGDPSVELPALEARIVAGEDVSDAVDLDSFVDFVIVEELTKNNDAYYLSHHLWRGEDGLVRFSPWDLDLTLGQPLYNDNTNAESWIAYRPDLIARLMAQPGGAERLARRWAAIRTDVASDQALLAQMDGYVAVMGDLLPRNFERWPIETIQFGGDQLPARASWQEEQAHVRAWIAARTAWMDANIGAY
jgi:hypothetical protein